MQSVAMMRPHPLVWRDPAVWPFVWRGLLPLAALASTVAASASAGLQLASSVIARRCNRAYVPGQNRTVFAHEHRGRFSASEPVCAVAEAIGTRIESEASAGVVQW